MRDLGSDSFTIIRAPLLVDPTDYSEYRDWNNPTRIVITKANIQPFPLAEKLNFEDNRDREYSRTAIRIFAPPGTDVLYTDRILFEGNEYDVFGHPGTWRRFNGQQRYIQFIARIREG